MGISLYFSFEVIAGSQNLSNNHEMKVFIYSNIVLLTLTAMSFGADGKLPTIAEVAKANHDLSTLVKAAMAAGAMELLDKPGNLTVFAPNNAAFAKLPKG